jgi:hypothetical protein
MTCAPSRLGAAALADRSVIRSVQFDTASIETDGREPKEMLVEISDTSATDGFKPLARATLSAAPKDGQRFNAVGEIPGRWLRVSIKSMQDPTHDIAQIMEFRAFGERLTHNPSPTTVTGTYTDPDGAAYHLKQTGQSVTGCFDGGTQPIDGGLEGRLLRFTWQTEHDNGPAIAVFGSNGQLFIGHWQADSAVTEHPVMNALVVTKKNDQPNATALGRAANRRVELVNR